VLIATFAVLCALAYLALAALLAANSRPGAPRLVLVAACAATVLWAAAQPFGASLEARAGGILEGLDVLRVSAWLAFLAVAVRAGPASRRPSVGACVAVGGVGAVAALLLADAARSGSPGPGSLGLQLPLAHLVLAITGLVLVEALLRRARDAGHHRIRYLVLGIGGILAYDAFLWSQALLFARADPFLRAAEPIVSLLALPLLAIGAARNRLWATELNLARRAVLHSATLFVMGAYLLGLSVAGAIVRETGGAWGPSLQAAFLFAGGLGLALVWASPSARAALRVELGHYLFTHRHDYREQWERFAKELAASDGTVTGAARALGALADVTGSLWGALWLRDGEAFVLAASRGAPAAALEQLSDGVFTAWLEARSGAVSELAGAAGLPAALDWGWIVVPLVRERLVGLVVLSRPRGRKALHAEDAELLRIAGVHAASSLLADQRARRLGEVQRFEEVSRGLAFVAHDLRNVANELTLTLANARKHIGSPDFQRDLILSMEASVRGMQRLLDKVARRRQDVVPAEPVDLAQMVVATVRTRRGAAPQLAFEHEPSEVLPIAADPERLAAMSGHLVQNALDAAGADGHVTVTLRRAGEHALLEVVDDGPGMSRELLRDRLRHPFQSRKPGGFGLGLFECRELASALGGELAVESEPGRGTAARLRLPLAKTSAGKEVVVAGHG
jgi:putative PEP-CTERM system histidine kinase